MTALHTIDWLVILGYFMGLLALAWWVILKSKDTADDYFLAGRNLGWWVIGASIFASNIGSEHLVGLAGSGATSGVAMAHYELHAWCLLVLGWVMVPFYMRSRVYTMPEFLERRFSPTARWVLSIISLVAYILTKIAVGHLRGRRRVRHAHSRVADEPARVGARQLLDRLAGGGAPDRPVHRPRRHARGRLHRGGPDGDPRPRLGHPHLLRPADDRRLGRVPGRAAVRHVQPLEAAGSRGHGGHLGPGDRARPDRLVLQRQLPLARDALLRAHRRALVLDAPTSTSSSARSAPRASARRAAAPSSRPS